MCTLLNIDQGIENGNRLDDQPGLLSFPPPTLVTLQSAPKNPANFQEAILTSIYRAQWTDLCSCFIQVKANIT